MHRCAVLAATLALMSACHSDQPVRGSESIADARKKMEDAAAMFEWIERSPGIEESLAPYEDLNRWSLREVLAAREVGSEEFRATAERYLYRVRDWSSQYQAFASSGRIPMGLEPFFDYFERVALDLVAEAEGE